MKGDGSVFGTRTRRTLKSGVIAEYQSYAIQLEVGSIEFARFFNARCSEALGRPQVAVRGPDKKGMFFVTYRSKEFGRWWKAQSLGTLRPYIQAFPLQYLRGRFDSEANVNASSVTMHGAENHRDVMQHDRDLCELLGMRVGPIHVYCRKGTSSRLRGRLIVTTMDKLRSHVNARDFLRIVGGLAVKNRDERLKAMIKGRAWTPWSKQIRERSLKMFNSGMNPKEISAELERDLDVDVPTMTIYFWIKRRTISWSEFKQS